MARTFPGSTNTDKIVTALTAHSTQFTFAAWVKRTADTVGRIFDKRTASGQTELIFLEPGNTAYNFELSGATKANVQFTWPTVNVLAHIAITGDRTNGSVAPKAYINGVLQTPLASQGVSVVLDTNSDPYVIGNGGGSGTSCFPGDISEFAKWNRILVADELVSLAKGFSPLFYRRGLILYYDLIRNIYDRAGGAPTVTGTTVADHPRVIFPVGPLSLGGPSIVSKSSSDSGSIVETVTSQTIGNSDSSSGTEVVSGQGVENSDTFTGTSVTLTQLVIHADTGAGTELVTSQVIGNSDVRLATESAPTSTATQTTTDSATLVEPSNVGQTSTDSGTDIELGVQTTPPRGVFKLGVSFLGYLDTFQSTGAAVAKTSSDSGTTTELVSANTGTLVSSDTPVAAENATSSSTNNVSSDSSTAIETQNVGQVSADSGVGTSSEIAPAQTFGVFRLGRSFLGYLDRLQFGDVSTAKVSSDSGSVVESVSAQSALLTTADVSLGVEALSNITQPSTDIRIAAESAPAINQTTADVESATELTNGISAPISGQDIEVATEGIPSVSQTNADIRSATEGAGSVSETSTDTSVSVETGGTALTFPSTPDTGTDVELANIAQSTVVDTATTVEGASVLADIVSKTDSDSASITESQDTPPVSAVEIVTAVEISSIVVTTASSDIFTGLDNHTLSQNQSEIVLAIDLANNSQSSVDVFSSNDFAANVNIPDTDILTGIDTTVSAGATFTSLDTASAIELTAIILETAADTFTSVEGANVNPVDVDSFVGTETGATLVAGILTADTPTAVEGVSNVNARTTDTGTTVEIGAVTVNIIQISSSDVITGIESVARIAITTTETILAISDQIADAPFAVPTATDSAQVVETALVSLNFFSTDIFTGTSLTANISQQSNTVAAATDFTVLETFGVGIETITVGIKHQDDVEYRVGIKA